jgi:hypothetical protein
MYAQNLKRCLRSAQSEKMALIRYCEELKGDNPELRKLQTYSMYRIKYLFSKFPFISVNTFLKWVPWTSAIICDGFKTTTCIQPRKKCFLHYLNCNCVSLQKIVFQSPLQFFNVPKRKYVHALRNTL